MISSITIPLQPQVTVTGEHHSPAVTIPDEVWQAVEVWQCIQDDQEADCVAVVLQERINQLCQLTRF